MEKGDYPLVLTTKDLQQILGYGREKVFEIARSKGFPRLPNTRLIKVPRDAFFQWLETAPWAQDEVRT